MRPDGTVEVSHLWKRFRADRRRRLLRDRLHDIPQLLRGKRRGWTWALKDVNVAVQPGESLGLIGINGSGKSTLLKIMSKVMYPYAGAVDVRGRVGALIEVRAGLHPDLTGRENIFMYGTLLGLSRRQVTQRFDEIVAFGELVESIDRQTKFYSSGMQMRLGFSVAAFLEPNVLLIDEVLAVGDAVFQQKCLERIREVRTKGTTVVFVSHDLPAVEAICERGVWLSEGSVREHGPIGDVLGAYRRSIEERTVGASDGDFRVLKLQARGPEGGSPRTRERLTLECSYETIRDEEAQVHLGVSEGTANPIFVIRRDLRLRDGEGGFRCEVEDLPLPRGRYFVWMSVAQLRGRKEILPWQPVGHFDVQGPALDAAPAVVVRAAPVFVEASWAEQ